MKKRKKVTRSIVVCLLIAIFMTGCSSGDSVKREETKFVTYDCDVQNATLRTKIEVNKDGEYFGEVSGDIFKFITDPLTMYDAKKNKIAYAGDAYNFINQDSHGIYTNDTFMYDMNGLFDMLGESYEIYDKEKDMIATVKVNYTNTFGTICNTDNVVVAEYTSGYFRKDFAIRIYENCEIDETSVIMIFCSYYSDYKADN